MPMHDWTRVSAGTYHAFHNAWITHIQEALNGGGLPKHYYALGEQRTGQYGPDVLTLRSDELKQDDILSESKSSFAPIEGAVALETCLPQVRYSQEVYETTDFYLRKQRQVVIRHNSGDRIVAIIEIVSPANRHTVENLHDFVDKVIDMLLQQIHVVVIDPFPGGKHDPNGIHSAIWERLMGDEYLAPLDHPLTLVSYTASYPIKAWIEPFSVGTPLKAMPLFLTKDQYVLLPLEETYNQSWSGLPNRWKKVICPEA